MRFLPVNLDALLVELDDLPHTLALLASLQADPIVGIQELVPAARTVLVCYRPATISCTELVARIGQRSLTAVPQQTHPLVEIAVHYTGEDLIEVANLLGLSPDEVIRRHTSCEYTVAFTGFAPGFAYLSGGDPRLNVPRRATPRTRIPAGAVAMAGEFSGVYPQASPGGWQIIGVTGVSMWDLSREVPALLQPGFKVRFVDAAGRPSVAPRALAPPAAARWAPHNGPAIEVRRTGLQALLQDNGRYGLAAQGVSTSGAMDKGSLRLANRLVGNAHDAVCIEVANGGFELVSHGDTVVAFAGADAPVELTLANGVRSTVAGHAALALSDGDALALGEPRAGVRSYLAVRGGLLVAPVLGSRSTDTLSKVGPPPVAAGDVFAVCPVIRGAVVDHAHQPRGDLPQSDQFVTLDVVMGPRTDWFTPDAVALFASQIWQVTPQSSRVGLRLLGAAPLIRANPAELPSEGTVLGAIQVPPNGQPVLFLADHPLTGGYPVIGAVASYDLDRAAQIPVGASVRFRPISPFCEHTP